LRRFGHALAKNDEKGENDENDENDENKNDATTEEIKMELWRRVLLALALAGMVVSLFWDELLGGGELGVHGAHQSGGAAAAAATCPYLAIQQQSGGAPFDAADLPKGHPKVHPVAAEASSSR